MTHSDSPMTVAQCTQIRGGCREAQAARVAAEVSKVMAPLSKIESAVEEMSKKIDELMELFDRVRALEMWKASHDGRAEQGEVEGEITEMRDSIAKAVERSHGKIIAELKTRKGDGINIPRWAVYPAIGVLLVILLLAAMAGEHAIPYILGLPHVTP